MKGLAYLITVPLLSLLLLTGCGGQSPQQQSPEDTVNTAFTALKELDIDTFNDYTNNKQIGNRIFSELLRRNVEQSHLDLAQVLVQDLSWEITDTQIHNDTATVTLTVQNHDFSNALSTYVADLIRNVVNSQATDTDLARLIKDTINEARNAPQNLLPYLQACNTTMSVPITVNLKQNNNCWQIQLDDTLCNALIGNFCDEEVSREVERKLAATEELLNHHLERLNANLKENKSQWVNQLTGTLEEVFR